jgi:hypothetical protein
LPLRNHLAAIVSVNITALPPWASRCRRGDEKLPPDGSGEGRNRFFTGSPGRVNYEKAPERDRARAFPSIDLQIAKLNYCQAKRVQESRNDDEQVSP